MEERLVERLVEEVQMVQMVQILEVILEVILLLDYSC